MQGVIDETSMNEALSKLSVDDKVKFWMTVTESDAEAGINGSEQMKAEFEKLSEENRAKFVELITKVKTDPTTGAPLLELAGEKGKAWYIEQTKDLSPEQQAAMDADPEKKKEWSEKYRAYVMEELKPIYARAFERHDTDKSGKLSKEQMAILSNNTTKMTIEGMEWGMQSFAPSIAVGLLGEGEHSDADKQAKTEKVLAAVKPAVEAIMKPYLDNKASKDDEVFAALDGGSGVTLDTFIELCIDGSETQKKMGEIIGLTEEGMMAKIGELAA